MSPRGDVVWEKAVFNPGEVMQDLIHNRRVVVGVAVAVLLAVAIVLLVLYSGGGYGGGGIY
jgi:hypothetical protein